MEIEYEAKFLNIDKDEVRKQLEKAGATLKRPETVMKRWIFEPPVSAWREHTLVRVRDEWGKTVITFKEYPRNDNEHPKEIEFVADDFDRAIEMFTELGCPKRSYQESMREIWHLDDGEISIDTWPFHEPFVEIEGASEEILQPIAEKLGFDWSQAVFTNVNRLFQRKYGSHIHMRDIPRVAFDMENPFLNRES